MKTHKCLYSSELRSFVRCFFFAMYLIAFDKIKRKCMIKEQEKAPPKCHDTKYFRQIFRRFTHTLIIDVNLKMKSNENVNID